MVLVVMVLVVMVLVVMVLVVMNLVVMNLMVMVWIVGTVAKRMRLSQSSPSLTTVVAGSSATSRQCRCTSSMMTSHQQTLTGDPPTSPFDWDFPLLRFLLLLLLRLLLLARQN